jgi:hypothetical protein
LKAFEKFIRWLTYREVLVWADQNPINNYEVLCEALLMIGVDMEMQRQYVYDQA